MSRNKPIVAEPDNDHSAADYATANARMVALRAQLAEEPRAIESARRAQAEFEAIVAHKVESLAALRRARELTQSQMASSLDISQGDVSKIEQRTNIMLTTLARFIEATGGHLRIVADYGDDQIEVAVDGLLPSGNR